MTKPPNTSALTAASQETVKTIARLQSDLDLAKAENVRLREALDRAKAAIWDSHYGNGIEVEYARKISAEIDAALKESS